MIPNRTILVGDVLEKMKEIPNDFIDCIISSPPYWRLRDYSLCECVDEKFGYDEKGMLKANPECKKCLGIGKDTHVEKNQWGKEENFNEYLNKLKNLMDEAKRILKSTGSCWINLGDSYGIHRSDQDQKMVAEKQEQENIPGYEKSRLGIPERFYIQSIDSGWIARNHIPWYKSNSMPSSIPDRFTNKWESIFFFVKNNDTMLWRNKITKEWTNRKPLGIEGIEEFDWKYNDKKKKETLWRGFDYYFDLDQVREEPIGISKSFNIRVREAKKGRGQAKLGGEGWKMAKWEDQAYDKNGVRKQDVTLGADGQPIQMYKNFNKRWQDRKHSAEQGLKHYASVEERIQQSRDNGADHELGLTHENGKNPGDVFFINPRPFNEAHFATFPIDLPLKILKCACPPDGIVLDPFFGAGTVGVAAEMLARNWMGIELKDEYVKLARKRLEPYNIIRLEQYF